MLNFFSGKIIKIFRNLREVLNWMSALEIFKLGLAWGPIVYKQLALSIMFLLYQGFIDSRFQEIYYTLDIQDWIDIVTLKVY